MRSNREYDYFGNVLEYEYDYFPSYLSMSTSTQKVLVHEYAYSISECNAMILEAVLNEKNEENVYPDISVKDTLVMDVLVTDISVTGHFGNRTFR